LFRDEQGWYVKLVGMAGTCCPVNFLGGLSWLTAFPSSFRSQAPISVVPQLH